MRLYSKYFSKYYSEIDCKMIYEKSQETGNAYACMHTFIIIKSIPFYKNVMNR